jgi:hypothetical protein
MIRDSAEEIVMKNYMKHLLPALVLGVGIWTEPGIAADTGAEKNTATVKAEIPDTASESHFDILLGQWVRPDGGYTITIQGVAPDGKLDATYANPSQLPFAQAKAALNDNTIEVFLELRAGGYNGSTYNLTYDPANDVLRGVYYQAVAQQKFEVYFERVK